jgi:hypothetical protein
MASFWFEVAPTVPVAFEHQAVARPPRQLPEKVVSVLPFDPPRAEGGKVSLPKSALEGIDAAEAMEDIRPVADHAGPSAPAPPYRWSSPPWA